MNYRTILLVIASVVVLIAVTFIMYKQSVNNVAQPLAEQNGVLDVGTEQKLQEQVAPLVADGDMSACDQVQDDMYKKVCINNIALKKAGETRDISYCQYIDNELIPRERCERQVIFRKSIEQESKVVCGETKIESLKKECEDSFYSRISTETGNPALCDQDTNKANADLCWNSYYANLISVTTAIFNKSPFECNIFRGEEVMADCLILAAAVKVGDFGKAMELCQTLKTKIFFNACMPTPSNIQRYDRK